MCTLDTRVCVIFIPVNQWNMCRYVTFQRTNPSFEHTFVTFMFQLQVNYKWVFKSLPLVTLYDHKVTAQSWSGSWPLIFDGTMSCPDQGCAKFLTKLTEHFHGKDIRTFSGVLYYQCVTATLNIFIYLHIHKPWLLAPFAMHDFPVYYIPSVTKNMYVCYVVLICTAWQ